MILIPFSAGLDSTTLVYQALEKKEQFETCYIELKNNENKSKVERQQRKKIISLFEKKYNVHIHDNFGTEIMVSRNRMVELPQVPAWMCGLMYYVDSNITEVRMGYCMNDDAISYIDDLKKMWKSYQAICGNKLPKLTFPLAKKKKIHSMQELSQDIFQETFFCENPRLDEHKPETEELTWRDCGRCHTCERAKFEETFKRYNRNEETKRAGFLSKAVGFSSSEPDPGTDWEVTLEDEMPAPAIKASHELDCIEE